MQQCWLRQIAFPMNILNQGPLSDPYWMIRNAEALQCVVKRLNNINSSTESADSDPHLFHGRVLAGPILLTLATEIALKALLCQEQKKKPPRTHDLLDLFNELAPTTRKALEAQMPGWTMYPVGFPEGSPYPHESLLDVLWRCRNAHTDWRYIHEKGWGFWHGNLDQALTLIIRSYYKALISSAMC